MTHAVAGILLAAGTSSRMGRNKMLLELGGESLLRGAARRALSAELSPLVVVLGSDEARARQELDGLECQVVVNADFEQGITSSMRAGVTSLAPDIDAAMILLADMPYVTADMMRSMVARFREVQPPLVISDYDGVNAPPILYRRALFAELLETTVEGCGKQVVRRHRAEAAVMQWPGAALADLDVPADYDRIANAH